MVGYKLVILMRYIMGLKHGQEDELQLICLYTSHYCNISSQMVVLITTSSKRLDIQEQCMLQNDMCSFHLNGVNTIEMNILIIVKFINDNYLFCVINVVSSFYLRIF